MKNVSIISSELREINEMITKKCSRILMIKNRGGG